MSAFTAKQYLMAEIAETTKKVMDLFRHTGISPASENNAVIFTVKDEPQYISKIFYMLCTQRKSKPPNGIISTIFTRQFTTTAKFYK